MAFLDSDDLWHPQYLSSSLQLSKRHNVGLIHSPYLRFRYRKGAYEGFTVRPPAVIDSSNVLRKNFIPLLSVMVDRELIGDFSFPSFRPEDYALWCDLVLKRGFRSVSTGINLAYYRVSINQRSSNKILALRRLFAFYHKYLGLPLAPAVSCVVRWSIFNLLDRKNGFTPLYPNLNSMLMRLDSIKPFS